nr:hypothetical protein GCM10010200_038600 [Actinomadura rugatobispora]
MLANHIPAPIADTLLTMQAAAVNTPAEISPAVEQITTNPPRTFKTWATANISHFH